MTKHILSVSLGDSARDFCIETDFLGEAMLLERRGMDGDMQAAAQYIQHMDGKVAAFGLGGIDLYLYVGATRYTIRDAQHLAHHAKQSPIVCGAGLKQSLEKHVIQQHDWHGKKVLMVSAIDRYGMAEAFVEAGAEILLGDILFSLDLPIPLYYLSTLRIVAWGLLPVMTQLPFAWLYPTGKQQQLAATSTKQNAHHSDKQNSQGSAKQNSREKYRWAYDWAEVIAGDWHYIKKYAPTSMQGKTVVTNTTTPEDIRFLRERGVNKVITTTPRLEGRSLATNVLESALIAHANQFPLSAADYQSMVENLNLQGDILQY